MLTVGQGLTGVKRWHYEELTVVPGERSNSHFTKLEKTRSYSLERVLYSSARRSLSACKRSTSASHPASLVFRTWTSPRRFCWVWLSVLKCCKSLSFPSRSWVRRAFVIRNSLTACCRDKRCLYNSSDSSTARMTISFLLCKSRCIRVCA